MTAASSSQSSGKGVPGIVEAPLEGRARIAGTGIEVWEVVRRYRALREDFTALEEAYHWLTDEQLHAALTYAENHVQEIEDRLDLEETSRLEDLWVKYPQTRPRLR